MRILGIETSCDETGIAIYDDVDGMVAVSYKHLTLPTKRIV